MDYETCQALADALCLHVTLFDSLWLLIAFGFAVLYILLRIAILAWQQLPFT